MLFDEKAQVSNQGPLDPGEDSPPRDFYGSTVGDELRMSKGGKSKVVSLAVKEHGALLLEGRAGTDSFFSDQIGDRTTSTYDMKSLPCVLLQRPVGQGREPLQPGCISSMKSRKVQVDSLPYFSVIAAVNPPLVGLS